MRIFNESIFPIPSHEISGRIFGSQKHEIFPIYVELCLLHNAQMLKSTSEIVAKTKLLTDTLDSTKKQMGEKMEVLQKSYTKLEEKSNQVESI